MATNGACDTLSSEAASLAKSPMQSQKQAAVKKRVTRSACDKCHISKLRFTKSADINSCQRCARLHVNCVFSPRSSRSYHKRQRIIYPGEQPLPALLPAAPTTIREDSAGRASMNRTEINLDCAMITNTRQSSAPTCQSSLVERSQLDATILQGIDFPFETQSLPEGIPAYNGFATQTLVDHCLPYQQFSPYELQLPSAIYKLADLNLSIYNCAKKLPSVNLIRSNEYNNAKPSCRDDQSKTIVLFVLDELFKHTSELIDLMKILSLGNEDLNTPLPINSNLCELQELSLANDAAYAVEKVSHVFGRFAHLDEATALVLLSCLCQLADIYTSIFNMMQSCAQGILKGPRALSPDRGILLPSIQIGSFTSHPPVRVDNNTPIEPNKASLYMNIIAISGSRLWDQVTEIVTGKTEGATDNAMLSPETWPPLIDEKWSRAVSVTCTLSRTIRTTKQILNI
ncbi:hypothetical protein F5Y16DRAFT_393063, partial [Xylariaceae sp. FL0255]